MSITSQETWRIASSSRWSETRGSPLPISAGPKRESRQFSWKNANAGEDEGTGKSTRSKLTEKLCIESITFHDHFQTSSGNRSRPKRGNGTNTPDELEKDKKHPKSPALHGSPSEKKQKQNNNNKETPTKNRKRNQNESDDKDDKETPSKKKKNDDMDVNDETMDNFEEKNSPIQLKLEKCDKIEEKEDKLQIKQEKEDSTDKSNSVTLTRDKLNDIVHLKQEMAITRDNKKLEMEHDTLKLNSLALQPVTVLVANTSDKNADSAKSGQDEENNEKPKSSSEETESDKVMTIDPKTGLIGPDVQKGEGEPLAKGQNISNALSPRPIDLKSQSSSQMIKNIPTMVIVRDEKTESTDNRPEVNEMDDLSKSTVRNPSKEINLIIPRPNFPSACDSQSGLRLPMVQTKSDVLKPSDNQNKASSPAAGSSASGPGSSVQLNLTKPKSFLVNQSEIKLEPRDEKDMEPVKNPENFEDKGGDKKDLINFSISKLQDQSEKVDQEDSGSSQMGIIKQNPNLDYKAVEKKERKFSEGSAQDEGQEKDSKPPVLTPNVSLPVSRDIKDNMPPGLVPMAGIPPHLLGPHVPLSSHHYNYPFGNPNRGIYSEKPTISIPNYGQGSNEEPQNLKIKQEVIQSTDNFDPIQNLKDLKVPGQSPSSESPRSTFLPGPSIENIKKEPENYQNKEGKLLSPQIGSNPNGSSSSRSDRDKEYPGIGIIKMQEKEDRDVKPEEESHTPPLPPTTRSSAGVPTTTTTSGYVYLIPLRFV